MQQWITVCVSQNSKSLFCQLSKEVYQPSILGCFTKTCFRWKKLAQPALQVFGGCFEGIQKDFWFWQPCLEKWGLSENLQCKKGQNGNDLCTPKNLSNSKSKSKQPPNTCRAGWANFFIKKHFFVKHPNEGIHMFSVVIIQPIYNVIQLSHWSSQRLSWLVQPWLVIRTYLKNYFTTLAFEMDDSNSRFRCTIVLPAHWLVSAFFMLLSWLYDTWCQTPF